MIATRPDWCISRQRIWGVPIAVFLCESCSQPILDPALNKKVIDLFEREGAEAWHTTDVASLLPACAKCAHCGGTSFRKETDILDVWFDSGTSWFAVAESDPDLKAAYQSFQKNEGAKVLYLEGGDQHRGWFHSSLLTSVALRGRAPYSHVATRRLDPRRAGPCHVEDPRQRRRSCGHRRTPRRRNRPPLGRLHRLPRRHGGPAKT